MVELIFFSGQEKYSGIRVLGGNNEPRLVSGGIFVGQNQQLSKSLIPELVFGFLPPDGRVLLGAVADSRTEHSNVVKMLKQEGLPYSEGEFSYERDKAFALSFKGRKELVTKPLLLATIRDSSFLHRVIEYYTSWLYFRDFLLLGYTMESMQSREMLEALAKAKDCDVPAELLDENVFLMITAQDHGAYVLTKKLSKNDVEKTTRKVCSRHNLPLVVKEHSG